MVVIPLADVTQGVLTGHDCPFVVRSAVRLVCALEQAHMTCNPQACGWAKRAVVGLTVWVPSHPICNNSVEKMLHPWLSIRGCRGTMGLVLHLA